MTSPIQIIGSPMSPYVRKVLVCLELKKLAYEIDPIVPFFGDDSFSRLSPLRRIPVLIDDRTSLCDSTVICQYLEDRYPEPALYPRDVAERARARWLEEFADSRMGDVFIWRLFNQVAIKPRVWNEPTEQAVVKQTLEVEIPSVLDYLEGELPAQGFCFGEPGIADISLASFFRNAAFARYQVDAARWPRTAAFVARTLALPPFQKLARIEDSMARTPIPKQRDALRELGVALTAKSFGSETPRRGVMPI
ncbi:MAG TPA: glutathione S-transferase family protein [Myxococcota bacterium]|nr:glutathione S-transferase family protein [Myxococcota bacterium]